MVVAEGVAKSFGDRLLVEGMDFAVPPGAGALLGQGPGPARGQGCTTGAGADLPGQCRDRAGAWIVLGL